MRSDRGVLETNKQNFGSNRNKPKQDLFRLCFGLFRETKNKQFWFVSVFRTYIETTETNRTVLKLTETTLNFLKRKYALYQTVSVGLRFVPVQSQHRNSLFRYRTEQKHENMLSVNCFGCSSVCFASVETPKLSVSVKNRNNRNNGFVSDSAETSFGSSFGCFDSKLVSKDTLVLTLSLDTTVNLKGNDKFITFIITML